MPPSINFRSSLLFGALAISNHSSAANDLGVPPQASESEESSPQTVVPPHDDSAIPPSTGALLRRTSRRTGTDDYGINFGDVDGWGGDLGDFLGDSGMDLDLCAILEMAEGLAAGGVDGADGDGDGDGVADVDVECTSDDDGTTELSMTIDGRVECVDPGLCVRDLELTLRMNFGDMFGSLLGSGGGGSDGTEEEEGTSFKMCFTYDDDVVEEQLRGMRFCMAVDMAPMSGLFGGGGGAGVGGLLSGCEATLDGRSCRCEICDGRLGMEMSCDVGEDFEMECTDFPLLEDGVGTGVGTGKPLAAIEPRNLMIPRLVSSRGGGVNVDEGKVKTCVGSKVWCPSMEKCISPQKKCLGEEALARRRRRRRRKGMFADKKERKAAKKKVGGKKRRDGMFKAVEERDMD